MNATSTDWIAPGAEVVLYSESAEYTDVDVRLAKVATVARGMFTVDAPDEPRFSVHFPEAETGTRYIRCVVARESERGQKLTRKASGADRVLQRHQSARAALEATGRWMTTDQYDRERVQSAIDALTALRDAL